MDVDFRIGRKRVVDYMGQVLDIQSSGCYVCSYKDSYDPFPHLSQYRLPFSLGKVSMESFCIIASGLKLMADFITLKLGAAEYHSIEVWISVDDSGKGFNLICLLHFEVDLVCLGCGSIIGLGPHQFRSLHEG